MIHNEQDHQFESVVSNGIKSSETSISVDEKKHDRAVNESPSQNVQEHNDEFIRITAAQQILLEAQTYDQQKNYPLALHLYRICVDFLLEELMFAEGTEQSRIYLRAKCTSIMDHIDFLKTKLQSIPSLLIVEQSIDPTPIDQITSLNLS